MKINKWILFIFFSLVIVQANAQVTVCNNGLATVSIVSGFTVSIAGGYISQTSGGVNGKMDNQGTLQLTGDWNNQNTAASPNPFSTSAGTVVFNNTTALQNILGVNTTTFYNLTIDNTGGAAAGVSLSGNATATNILTLTNGVVTTGIYDLILSNATAANLSYTNGFVNGTFRRNIASNTSVYFFPVGNGTSSTNRHQVAFVNNSLTGPSYLDVSVTDNVQAAANVDANLNTTQYGTPITKTVGQTATVGHTVIWTITPDAARTGGDYGVQLYVENTDLSALDDDMFCPLKRDNASVTYADFLTYESLPTAIPADGAAGRIYNSGNGYAQRTEYTSFSRFSIGKGTIPFPIELLSFNANCNNQNVILSWSTASETNNNFFTIERSTDGIIFAPFGTVEGAGNSSTIKNYSFTDNKPETVFYYRLKQTDFDGKFKYSGIIVVRNCEDDLSELVIYPNPNNGIFTVEGSENEYELIIANVFGEKIVTSSINNKTSVIDLSSQPNGIYFLNVKIEQSTANKKIIINK